MKNIEYYDRMAKDLYNTAYSDGYSDGVKRGKEQYGQHSRGTAHCTRATRHGAENCGDGAIAEKLLRADG